MPSSFSEFITMPQDLLEVNEADIRLLEEIDRCLANAKPIIKLQMEQMDTEIFEGCFKVAQKYRIDIDEGRLMQALTDARKFYDEGYRAGKAAAMAEIVRCKDCKHFAEAKGKDSGKPCGYGQCKWPTGMIGIVCADEYCSFGERRSDDE